MQHYAARQPRLARPSFAQPSFALAAATHARYQVPLAYIATTAGGERPNANNAPDILVWPPILIHWHAIDRLQHFQSFCHLAKQRVLIVQAL